MRSILAWLALVCCVLALVTPVFAEEKLEAPVIAESVTETPDHMVLAEFDSKSEEKGNDMLSLIEQAIEEHIDSSSLEDAEQLQASLIESSSEIESEKPRSNSIHLKGQILDSVTGVPAVIPGYNSKTLPNTIVKNGKKLRKAWVVGVKKQLPKVTRIHRNERLLTKNHVKDLSVTPRYRGKADGKSVVYHKTGLKAEAQAVNKVNLPPKQPTATSTTVPVSKTVVHVLRENSKAERAALRSARTTLSKINAKRAQLVTSIRALTAARSHVEDQIHRHFVLKAIRARRLADGAARRAAWSQFLRRRTTRNRLLTKLKRWHDANKNAPSAARRAALAKFLKEQVPARDRAALHSFLRHLRSKHAISSARKAQIHARRAIAAAHSAQDAMADASAYHPDPAVRAKAPLTREVHDAEVARRVREAVKAAVLSERRNVQAQAVKKTIDNEQARVNARREARRRRAAHHRKQARRHRKAATKAAAHKALREMAIAEQRKQAAAIAAARAKIGGKKNKRSAKKARFAEAISHLESSAEVDSNAEAEAEAEAESQAEVSTEAGVDAELEASHAAMLSAEHEAEVDAESEAKLLASLEAKQQAEMAAQTQSELSMAAELNAATSTSSSLNSEALDSLSQETELEAEAADETEMIKTAAAVQAAAEETSDIEQETHV